jgi:hypothetical protein
MSSANNYIKVIDDFLPEEERSQGLDICRRATDNAMLVGDVVDTQIRNTLINQKNLVEKDRDFSNKFSSGLWDHTTEYLRKFEFCSPEYAHGHSFDRNFKIEELSFLKYKKGGFYKLHSDEDFLWKCISEWYRLISYVYFVNDDYSGGKLVFPQHDQKIHPKKNRLVIFPSNWCFEHTVEPVIKGTRYTIVTWGVSILK